MNTDTYYSYLELVYNCVCVCVLIDDDAVANPEAHEGRVRSFPHVRGNWASYVFLPLLFAKEQSCLDEFTYHLNRQFRLACY